jgi:hypothetical protein
MTTPVSGSLGYAACSPLDAVARAVERFMEAHPAHVHRADGERHADVFPDANYLEGNLREVLVAVLAVTGGRRAANVLTAAVDTDTCSPEWRDYLTYAAEHALAVPDGESW